jgi:Tfp pilus assembly protein PilN
VDFLSEAEREQKMVSLWQMGFKRTAIALGSILFLLLALQVAASIVLGQLNGQVENEMTTSHDVLIEVEGLRERVNALEVQVEGSQTGASEGNLSLVLHQLARVVPPSVRIDRLQAEAGPQNSVRLTLSLSARSQEAVTTFMKQLEQAGFSDVTLIRVSAAGGSANSSSLLGAELELSATSEAIL